MSRASLKPPRDNDTALSSPDAGYGVIACPLRRNIEHRLRSWKLSSLLSWLLVRLHAVAFWLCLLFLVRGFGMIDFQFFALFHFGIRCVMRSLYSVWCDENGDTIPLCFCCFFPFWFCSGAAGLKFCDDTRTGRRECVSRNELLYPSQQCCAIWFDFIFVYRWRSTKNPQFPSKLLVSS